MRKLVVMCSMAVLVGVGGIQLGLAAEPSGTALSVTVQGESYVKVGSVCTYWADVSGGSGSYTYEWTFGGTGGGQPVIGTGSSVNLTIVPGTHYGLAVRVWDGDDEEVGGIIIIPTPDGSDCAS
jgi:hypothetical protein